MTPTKETRRRLRRCLCFRQCHASSQVDTSHTRTFLATEDQRNISRRLEVGNEWKRSRKERKAQSAKHKAQTQTIANWGPCWENGGAKDQQTHLRPGDGSGLEDDEGTGTWIREPPVGMSSLTAGDNRGGEESDEPWAVWSASCDMVRNANGWW
jgi:hypothetical protein